ncbi:hypothetical protein [Mycoplasma wenyonii]|nr:hypothetical protein [Mycoplasma wenyonii]
MLSGLVLGVIGCVPMPLMYSNSMAGGGTEKIIETVTSRPSQSNLLQQLTPAVKKEEFPELLKTINLLLAGTNNQDGIVTQLSLYQEKNGNKRWDVNKVTWRGTQWKNNWTLFYDDNTGEYIFSDKDWIEKGDNTCWGQARKWNTYKVCLSHGVVLPKYKEIYRDKFPKIKLSGWGVKWSRYWWYSAKKMPNYLDYCENVSVEERNNSDLEITIGCKSSTLQKIFKNTEISDVSLSK